MTLPITLTIAGSDSGGGAGIQADLKTFHAFGTFGTSAITAITAQNTHGVTAIHPIPPDVVAAQIAAVAEDLPPAACKSGMLATRQVVETVAASLNRHRLPNYVLDPVMVSTSRARLLDADAEQSIREHLLPLATLITPNLDEAELLVGFTVDDPASMRRAAEALVEAGARAALLKGGHLDAPELIDILFDGESFREWRHPRRDTRNTHGTGCTLAAAITAALAQGSPLGEAVDRALDYLQRAIAAAPGLGGGHGPLNHLVGARGPNGENAAAPGSARGLRREVAGRESR